MRRAIIARAEFAARDRRTEPSENIQLSKSDAALFKRALGSCAPPRFVRQLDRVRPFIFNELWLILIGRVCRLERVILTS